MQIQPHPLPNYSLRSPIFSPSTHFLIPFSSSFQPTKLVSIPNFPSGSCGSLKRMSKSQTGLRSYGGLVSVRCEALQGKEDDGFYMRRCVELARKAIGCTSPNPMVGCVIVKDGKVVGEGFHPKAGQPHGEGVQFAGFALRDAGDLAENATAYGVDRLRDAGIEVTVAVEEELCKKLNEAYIHQMLTGKPFVTLRYSLSINGHILDQLGEGVEEAGGYYSQLVQEYDAIILSPTTVTEKFSFPASQEPGANQPLHILIAKSPISPNQIPIPHTEATSKVIIFADNETAVEPEMVQKGIETVVLDQINLNAVLEYCKRQGLCSILLDLRGNFGYFEDLLKQSLEENLLQKVVVEVLPFWSTNEEEGLPLALKNLRKGIRLKNITSRNSNDSVVLEGYP
ncbi:Riboflavin biosynthesis protein PYRD, chloroplastic [Vitis vinifera]|uniref:Riboflavin biosynthesis protein PYRD, chloroplastic n=1 Tax=Vitis vinifera TaxID=29760 RepID=A0A438D552_VITVI|nr:Riboflavin biosynthesis protein PYRD, chloroplastic [Vitis vinifera]